MRNLLHSIASMAIVGVALVLISCDRPPTTPDGPAGPAPASIVRVEITGPSSVAPGGSIQLKATAVKSDGSVEDVTTRAQWTTNTGAVNVTAAGVIMGLARGEVTVRAVYTGLQATKSLVVLPAGTFKLSGRITDMDVPLRGVRIEVVKGIGEGQNAITTVHGAYAIYGVAGEVTVQVKREGYHNQIHHITVGNHHTLDVPMTLEGPRQNAAGPYRLTITASCPADSKMPAEARIRAYDVFLEQNGTGLMGQVSGASLIVSHGSGDNFSGTLEGRTATFMIGWDPVHEPGIMERLSATQSLTITGSASTTSGPEGFLGTLDGTVVLWDSAQWLSIPCSTTMHRFELRRR